MAEIVITPNFGDPLTGEGIATQEFHTWLDQVTDAVNNIRPLTGSGTPEGNATASIGRWYVDTTASPADIYYKDTGDDTNTGWVITS